MTIARPRLREPKDPHQCLRISKVAELVGVKPRTIKAWVSKGTFPAPIKPTETLRLWLWSEVKAWQDAHKARRS